MVTLKRVASQHFTAASFKVLGKSSQRDVAVICTRKATEQRKQAQQLLMDAMTGEKRGWPSKRLRDSRQDGRLAAGLFSINEYCLASVLCCCICEVFVGSLVIFETLKIEKILKWRATKAQNNVKNNLIFKEFKFMTTTFSFCCEEIEAAWEEIFHHHI